MRRIHSTVQMIEWTSACMSACLCSTARMRVSRHRSATRGRVDRCWPGWPGLVWHVFIREHETVQVVYVVFIRKIGVSYIV